MVGFIELGTQKVEKNYQGIDYLFEVSDYILSITGNTYNHKEQLKAIGYKWNPDEKCWYKNFDNVEELKMAYEGWNDDGMYASIKSIYRQVKPI